MAGEFDPVMAPQEDTPKTRTLLIVLIVAVVIVCCCCFGCAAIYFGIEPVMEALGMPIPWY
jgi:hypothetical protein